MRSRLGLSSLTHPCGRSSFAAKSQIRLPHSAPRHATDNISDEFLYDWSTPARPTQSTTPDQNQSNAYSHLNFDEPLTINPSQLQNNTSQQLNRVQSDTVSPPAMSNSHLAPHMINPQGLQASSRRTLLPAPTPANQSPDRAFAFQPANTSQTSFGRTSTELSQQAQMSSGGHIPQQYSVKGKAPARDLPREQTKTNSKRNYTVEALQMLKTQTGRSYYNGWQGLYVTNAHSAEWLAPVWHQVLDWNLPEMKVYRLCDVVDEKWQTWSLWLDSKHYKSGVHKSKLHPIYQSYHSNQELGRVIRRRSLLAPLFPPPGAMWWRMDDEPKIGSTLFEAIYAVTFLNNLTISPEELESEIEQRNAKEYTQTDTPQVDTPQNNDPIYPDPADDLALQNFLFDQDFNPIPETAMGSDAMNLDENTLPRDTLPRDTHQ